MARSVFVSERTRERGFLIEKTTLALTIRDDYVTEPIHRSDQDAQMITRSPSLCFFGFSEPHFGFRLSYSESLNGWNEL
ncbi:hypothetical protein L596_010636 [Steinernema carpocapsae]|uniref:Uncharacterized protein n=1 Tax=Steinernema carpocapsae TaxID=34508 RepID=A0A4U5PJF3_STECR|nr:hypothetical protein L596_010636 [Steinernema carpocapsae]